MLNTLNLYSKLGEGYYSFILKRSIIEVTTTHHAQFSSPSVVHEAPSFFFFFFFPLHSRVGSQSLVTSSGQLTVSCSHVWCLTGHDRCHLLYRQSRVHSDGAKTQPTFPIFTGHFAMSCYFPHFNL